MDKKLKHLEMIQGVINRMAKNSFMLKGWAVTLIAGILALAGKDANKIYFISSYIPIIMFWMLDTYYLLQERLYRSLYEKVRKIDEMDIDFSLKATFDDFPNSNNRFFACLLSKTEVGFYLSLSFVCLVIICITCLEK